MPYFLTDSQKRCSPGTRRTSKKGERPIVCSGVKTKRSRKSKGCTYGRNRKTKQCYSKKDAAAYHRKLSKNLQEKQAMSRFTNKLRAYKRQDAFANVQDIDD